MSLQKEKGRFRRFLFEIVNQFSLDEFKKYTNFVEIAKRLVEKQNKSTKHLEVYIEKNFKRHVPDEAIWRKGAFVSLVLTNDFYGSETSTRIFAKMYGIKNCSVILSKLEPQSNNSTEHLSESDKRKKHLSVKVTEDEDEIEEVRTLCYSILYHFRTS